jgi:DNA helicase-2/ATP-dependent DNA helicase PcrA
LAGTAIQRDAAAGPGRPAGRGRRDGDGRRGAADETATADDALADLQARFEASEWANRVPYDVEVPFATVIAGVVIRGRMDAVYASPDGHFEIVDWKTGSQPRDSSPAGVQLAAYRLAWAALAGVPVERVSAAFFYVRDGLTVRPSDLLDEAGLVELITALPLSG